MSSFDVKAWKASEGLRRAQMLVAGLAEDGEANNNIIGPVLQHRMIEVIGRALDVALEDGSEQDALVGNGHAIEDVLREHDIRTGEDHSHAYHLKGPSLGELRAGVSVTIEKPAPKKRGPKKGSKRGRQAPHLSKS